MKIHALLCFLLRNPTELKRAKSSTCVNHGNDETRTQKALIPRCKNDQYDLRLEIKGFDFDKIGKQQLLKQT